MRSLLALVVLGTLMLDASASAATPACDHDRLSAMTRAELRLVRNEVYARHGRAFTSADLQAHFKAQDWYRVDPAYSDKRLSAPDKACVRRVQRWETVGGVLWKARADLDGDGDKEAIFVAVSDERVLKEKRDGPFESPPPAWILVDDHVVSLRWLWPESAYWATKLGKARFQIVNLDERTPQKHVWVRQHLASSEDPGIENHFVTLRKGKLLASALSAGDYNAGRIKILGEGKLAMIKATCPFHKVWYTLRAGKLIATGHERNPVPEHGCAACPFVDVRVGDRWIEQGEILRYLSHADLDGWQRLPIALPPGARSVRLRLRESKDEDTFVDSVRLVVGAHRLAPAGCDAEGSLCARDHQALQLGPGDVRELVFELPAGAEGPAALEAAGHYIPR